MSDLQRQTVSVFVVTIVVVPGQRPQRPQRAVADLGDGRSRDLAASRNLPLSSVVHPKHETAALAAQWLLQRIAQPGRAMQRTVHPTLIVRQSNGQFGGAAR